MKDGPESFLEHIGTLFHAGALGELSDRQLLDRFNGGDRASAELAFVVLVKRHGPSVFRACRAVLGDPHAAEDAFQATFLVLARQARRLWVRDSLGPWLLSVAGRVAACARKDAVRRRAREREAAARTTTSAENPIRDDRDAIILEEIDRLPGRYRSALILCDLEGLTQEEAARQLGWPAGTVRSRLSRGRQRLRERLTRRGLAPAGLVSGHAPLAEFAPDLMVPATVRAALEIGSGRSAVGVTTTAITLMEGALRIMYASQLKMVMAIVMAGAIFTGTGVVGYRAMGHGQAPAAPPSEPSRSAGPSAGKAAPDEADSPEVVELGKARLRTVLLLREMAMELWVAGATDTSELLEVERHYVAIRLEVAGSDPDRIRFLEEELARLKQIEKQGQQLFRSGQKSQIDLTRCELARLDIEYALAKLKAKTRAAK